ncbi:hypothetical protein OOK31_14715 [Streptomyces sp. NBC_00249]|uniref:hypothetical protein n=1 Tax=Streptomyces sp. NBC_00249 TaxID=2975690 RepID=UPI002257F5E8|nr:hypothetical protein [Streptomyces sp. NBC_00249]MCX5195138.1 hypothetical protein [Streptomyces sp. NBC_00249]
MASSPMPALPKPLRSGLSRLVLALAAGIGLVMAGPGAAHASQTVEVPAPSTSVVSLSAYFHGAIVPRTYDPDPSAYYGDRRCLLKYHEYLPTEGCGGFRLDVTLHNVRNSPGYQAGLGSTDYRFRASADTARTFRCVRQDGGSDRKDDVVVRTVGTALAPVYFYAESGYILHQFREFPDSDYGPQFYLNFPPEQINCPAGTKASQYGLKVTNLTVAIDDDNVFGRTAWVHPGALYA